MKNKRLMIILTSVGVLLSIPYIAMQFTNEVDWDISDFVIMGILLTTTGLLCELVMRKAKQLTQRLMICGLILFLFFMVWAELAVGVFGTPYAGS